MGGRRRFLTAREQHEMLSPWRSGLSRMAGSHTYDDDEASTPGPGKWRFHNGVTGESFHLYGPSENEAWKKYLDIVGCDCHANPEDHEYGEDEENPLENTYVDQWDDPKGQYVHLEQLTDPHLFKDLMNGGYDPETDPFDPRIIGASRVDDPSSVECPECGGEGYVDPAHSDGRCFDCGHRWQHDVDEKQDPFDPRIIGAGKQSNHDLDPIDCGHNDQELLDDGWSIKCLDCGSVWGPMAADHGRTGHEGWDPDSGQDPFDPRIIGASRKHAEQAKSLEWQRDSSGNWILVTRNPDGNPVAVTTKPAPNVRTSRRGRSA